MSDKHMKMSMKRTMAAQEDRNDTMKTSSPKNERFVENQICLDLLKDFIGRSKAKGSAVIIYLKEQQQREFFIFSIRA